MHVGALFAAAQGIGAHRQAADLPACNPGDRKAERRLAFPRRRRSILFPRRQPRPLVVDIAVRRFELHGAVDEFLAFLQATQQQREPRGGEGGVSLPAASSTRIASR
jgi:hypothetical protein